MRRVLTASAILFAGCGRVGFDSAALERGEVVEVAAGGFNGCVRYANGELWCWGMGDGGVLGDGIAAPHESATPLRVPVPPVAGVDVADGAILAWTDAGELYGWGPNANGMLGRDGETPEPALLPVADVAGTAHGARATCVLHTDRTVSCAGTFLELGTGETIDRHAFSPVPGIGEAAALAVGDDHVCALLATGGVTCWGAGTVGQLGNGMADSLVPLPGPLGPYVAIRAGDRHTCAIRAGGAVDCWGTNELGALGDGGTQTRATAAPVVGLAQATALASSSEGMCALRATGEVVCWGDNTFGALGEEVPVTPQRLAPGPPILTDVVEVAGTTGLHVCARTSDATVWCWGDNFRAQLASTTVGRSTPRVVALP